MIRAYGNLFVWAEVMFCALVAASAAHAAPCQQQPGGTTPALFSPNPPSGVSGIFMQAFPPPVDNSQNINTYADGPITDASTGVISTENCTTWSGHSWDFVWVNRSIQHIADNSSTNPKANPISPAITYQNIPSLPDPTVRTEYTTILKAEAATKAAVLYALGAPTSKWQTPLVNFGICAARPCTSSEAIGWSDLNADAVGGDPSGYFKNNVSADGNSYVLVDRMVIPKLTLSTNTLTNSYGVVLDYEVEDNRIAATAATFLEDMGDQIGVYGRKSYLYTNPFDGGALDRNGFSITTINDIEAHFDYIGLFALSTEPDNCHNFANNYANSITYLKCTSGTLPKGYGQIVVMVDLSLCASQDALDMYNQRLIDNFAGYYIFPNLITMGGQDPSSGANAVIWPLVCGTLPPANYTNPC